jgi:hypothetical protein
MDGKLFGVPAESVAEMLKGSNKEQIYYTDHC